MIHPRPKERGFLYPCAHRDKTNAGEKRKALLKRARELARDARAAMKASKTLPEARENARALESQAEQALAEADSLRDHAGWKTCISGRWRGSRPPKRASDPTATGWPPGERVIGSEMSIWGVAENLTLR